MSGNRILWGQITVVFAVVLVATWIATQWAAWRLGFQARLGRHGSSCSACRSITRRRLLVVVCLRRLCARDVQRRRADRGIRAASAGCAVAIIGSSGARGRTQLSRPTARRVGRHRARSTRPGLFRPAGVFLGRFDGHYLRHDGPEHVMAFAPTRSGKGVGLVVPTLLSWTGVRRHSRHQGRELAARPPAGARASRIACCSIRPIRRVARYNPLLEVRKGAARGPRRSEHRRHPGRSRRRARTAQPLGKDQPLAAGRRDPSRPLRRGGQDARRASPSFLSDPRGPSSTRCARMMATNHLGTPERQGPSRRRVRRARSAEQIGERALRRAVAPPCRSSVSIAIPTVGRATDGRCDWRIADLVDCRRAGHRSISSCRPRTSPAPSRWSA